MLGGATHCCPVRVASQREVPKKGWQLLKNRLSCLSLCPQGLQEMLRNHGWTLGRWIVGIWSLLSPL